MSTRTNATVREQSVYPEAGPTPKTFENCDVTLGNKLVIEQRLVVVFFNSAVAARTITYTYDDDAGQVRTLVVTLAAGEICPVQFEQRLGRHAADLPETGFAWFTASGSSGDVKMYALRGKLLLN
jgi:hypothetical protein